MSEFEDAFDRVKEFVDDYQNHGDPDTISTTWICGGFSSGGRDIDLNASDIKIVLDRLDTMIKEQRREALQEMAERDAELILKGY